MTNCFDTMIDEIKKSPFPTVVYGAGELSGRICDFLEMSGIDYEGLVVDKAYLPEKREKNGKPVFALEDYTAENKCDIVIGVMYFSEEKEAAMKALPNVNKVYTADFSGRYPLGVSADCRFTQRFLDENAAVLDKLKSDLCDDASREELDAFIKQRMNGDFRKRFSDDPQYFEHDIISLGDNEVFVDCGAFDGDTVKLFVQQLAGRSYSKIYAFEADPGNVEKMRKNTAGLDNIVIVPNGVYDRSTTLYFASDGKMTSHFSDSGTEVPVTSIDETVGDENVTFIKMDIEGSELKALHGAEKTIRRCRPKLAVCVYHRIDDIITIPQYIQGLDPSYKLYFRNYHSQSIEAVIYAV